MRSQILLPDLHERVPMDPLACIAGEGAVEADTRVEELFALEAVVAGHQKAVEESRAAAAYLRWLSPYLEERSQLMAEREGWKAQWQAEREGVRAEADHLRRETEALQSTATWRLRERLVRMGPLRRAYRWVRGVGSR